MSRLHELLAVEKTVVSAFAKILAETHDKFKKDNYFKGYVKSLKMLADSEENSATEKALSEVRELPTNVKDTLDYMLGLWVKSEDVIFQKNLSNQKAISDIEFRGKTILTNVPVDELMGLEVRLESLRKLFSEMPTHDATKKWVRADDMARGVYITTNPEVSTKTEKRMIPVVLHEATKEHPAQVKESTRDDVVGSFTITHYSGAATSLQKAESLSILDDLISEVKRARMRANSIEVEKGNIGKVLVDIIMEPFK